MLKVKENNEYKNVDLVYSEETEIEQIYDKNGNLVFDANNEIEDEAPISFQGKKSANLKNYRIYGNTVTVKEKNIITVNWKQGTIASEDGNQIDMTTRVRSEAIPVDPNTTYTVKATTPNDKVLDGWLLGYDVNNVKTIRYPLPAGGIIYPSWQYPITFTTSADTAYVRLVAKYADESEINIQPVTELYVGNKDYYGVEHYCGDRTANLFDKTKTNRQDNIARNADGSFNYNPTSSNYFDYYIPVKANTNYIAKGTSSYHQSFTPSRMYFFDADKNWLGRTDLSDTPYYSLPYINFTTPANCFFTQVQEDKSRPIDTDTFMIVEGTTVPESYIPYGYKIPVTLTADSAKTTDIYLDEPLAKSGNNADYIDYATQKRHNSDGTESSVTLPEITVTAGTNVLTVGTEVQPSSVEIKGRIKAAGGD